MTSRCLLATSILLLTFLSPALANFAISTPRPVPTSTTTTRPHFAATLPTTITVSPSQSTAISQALSSVAATWTSVISYKYLASEVFLAAPTDAQLSLAINGYDWDAIMTQTWYETGVASKWKSMVNKEAGALQSALDEVVGVKNGDVRLRAGLWVVLFGMGVVGLVLL